MRKENLSFVFNTSHRSITIKRLSDINGGVFMISLSARSSGFSLTTVRLNELSPTMAEMSLFLN